MQTKLKEIKEKLDTLDKEYFNTYMNDKPTAKAFIIGVARKVRIEKESSILTNT